VSPLYLHCGLCGRKQADGLLSRGHWGHVVVTDGRGLSACPTCREHDPDWAERLQGLQDGVRSAYGGSFRSSDR
jgi:hypothetical protein